MIPQFEREEAKHPQAHLILSGLIIFAIGLFKKTCLADSIQPLVSQAFGPNTPTFDQAWIGALAYTFQLYFDFSGYFDMSVRDTSQLMGAATTQQIAADVVAMIAVVNSGSRKSGSLNSVMKFCSVGLRALLVKANTASHDIGSRISATRTVANSHSTGLLQSMRAFATGMSVVTVMLARQRTISKAS